MITGTITVSGDRQLLFEFDEVREHLVVTQRGEGWAGLDPENEIPKGVGGTRKFPDGAQSITVQVKVEGDGP